MRYAELLFLVLLVFYHAVLLVPRHKRLFAANYLVFLAGMALVWNLALEGLRWQTLPPLVLFFFDLLVLFPTMSSLRGRYPVAGWWSALAGGARTLVAALALLVALASALLAVAFPLPVVELTGGITPSHRVVRFPPEGKRPGLELELWYPAAGDTHRQPRPTSEPDSWQQIRAQGGLPVFWQSYLDRLPSSSILGGRLAADQTQYPVVYVALPAGQRAQEFGYLFEDLASRGLVVAAGGAIPPAIALPPPFAWSTAFEELASPFVQPTLWLQPEASQDGSSGAEEAWLTWTQEAMHQLASEPGDVFYQAVDWTREGLWEWGTGSADVAQQRGFKAVVYAGSTPSARPATVPELWISALPATNQEPRRWVLTVPGLKRADLTDAAYLKPYLAWFGLKSQTDAGFHGAVRQYQAAFFQYALWHAEDSSFAQTVPALPGLSLSGH